MENFLSHLTKLVAKKKKRLGRGLGSGKGAKSGRGTTRHQKGRESIPLSFEGGQGRMVKKFPLLRGKGINKPNKKKAFPIKLGRLNIFKNKERITIETLIKKKVIPDEAIKTGVKILSEDKLDEVALTIEVPVSKKAKKAIEKTGGTVKI